MRFVIESSGFFLDLSPNVEICPIQKKTGFQKKLEFFSGLVFHTFEEIQLTSKVIWTQFKLTGILLDFFLDGDPKPKSRPV
jgi:hypothetical protein